MSTIALEVVPPQLDLGEAGALEEARKIRGLLEKHELLDWVNTLLLPQLITEDPDRPVPMQERMSPLQAYRALRTHIPASAIVTQVAAFTPLEELEHAVDELLAEGIERVVFVGVPRVIERPLVGPMPHEAMQAFKGKVPSLGAILIPSRPDELDRFKAKLDGGASFALTQLLFSDYIVRFLRELSQVTDHRPEILLSFGHVPQMEMDKGLIRWLIQDETSELAKQDMETVVRLAQVPLAEKKQWLADLCGRVAEGAASLGFPLALHLECPYGFSDPAFEVFSALREAWTSAYESQASSNRRP